MDKIMLLIGASYYAAKRALDWRDATLQSLYRATLADYADMDEGAIHDALMQHITRTDTPPSCAQVRALLDGLRPTPPPIAPVAPRAARTDEQRAADGYHVGDVAATMAGSLGDVAATIR